MRKFLIALAALAVAGSLSAHAQAKWKVTKILHIGQPGGWDYVTINPKTNRLFVTRVTHTDVVNTMTDKVVGNIPGQIHSHGVALVPALNRGFIADGGGSGAIHIFNLKTYAVLGTIHTMPDTDGMIYDRSMNLIVATSGDEGKLITLKPDVNPKTGKMGPPINLEGHPEFLAAGRNGRIYVNIPAKNLVDVVDLKTRKVVAKWPVAPGGRPVGMAIDHKDHLIFVGCRGPQKLIVMSTVTGKVVAALPIGAHVDATRYAAGQAFASCGNSSELVVAGKKDGKWVVEQDVKTGYGARTLGIDRLTHTIFLPTVKYGPPGPNGHRRMIPGTFMLIKVSQQ